MTQPHASASPRRTNADYRWTRDKICAFLEALVETGGVAGAARAVGMSRQSAYRLRARLGPGFGEVWDEGLCLSAQWRRENAAAKVTPAPQGDTTR